MDKCHKHVKNCIVWDMSVLSVEVGVEHEAPDSKPDSLTTVLLNLVSKDLFTPINICNGLSIYHDKPPIDSDKCSFCQENVESIDHLFRLCCSSQEVWYQLLNKWQRCTGIDIHYSRDSVILGNFVLGKPSHVINMLGVLIKQYIYRCRCTKTKPYICEAESIIERTRLTELFNAKLQGELAVNKHFKKWAPIHTNYQTLI